jgi:hypothetical protein
MLAVLYRSQITQLNDKLVRARWRLPDRRSDSYSQAPRAKIAPFVRMEIYVLAFEFGNDGLRIHGQAVADPQADVMAVFKVISPYFLLDCEGYDSLQLSRMFWDIGLARDDGILAWANRKHDGSKFCSEPHRYPPPQ